MRNATGINQINAEKSIIHSRKDLVVVIGGKINKIVAINGPTIM